MKDFAIADELWHRVELQPSAKILCSAFSAVDKGGTGKMEPVVICTDFGKGRCFNLVLGHDTGAMHNINWRMLMLRGTEWAATGNVQGEVRE
jgi:type 1 glutamine amidotransferase